MKNIILSLLLLSTFSVSEAKNKHEKNQSTETTTLSTTTTESVAPLAPIVKPGTGSAKTRTLRAGLIMMGAGMVSTLTGTGLALGASEDHPVKGVVGVGLFLAGISSTVSGAVVTLIGIALPRD